VAWVEPETAPNSVQLAAVVIARPPRRCPTKRITRSSSRSAAWPLVTMSAAKMNIGTAISATGCTPPIICWMMICGSMPPK